MLRHLQELIMSELLLISLVPLVVNHCMVDFLSTMQILQRLVLNVFVHLILSPCQIIWWDMKVIGGTLTWLLVVHSLQRSVKPPDKDVS